MLLLTNINVALAKQRCMNHENGDYIPTTAVGPSQKKTTPLPIRCHLLVV